MNESHRLYRLDGIEIDTAQVCLRRNGQEEHLRAKTFQVLIYLLERRDRVVTKNELIEQIWAGAAVSDNTLDQCVAEIRRLVGDNSRQRKFIKTVPRTGYRFIGDVQEIDDNQLIIETSKAPAVSETVTEPNDKPGGLKAVGQRRWLARGPVLTVVSIVAILGFGLASIYLIRRRTAAAMAVRRPRTRPAGRGATSSAGTADTSAMKRYPVRGTVST